MIKHLPKMIEISLGLMPKEWDHFHTTFLYHKSRIVSIGINNTRKTHPKNLQYDYVDRNGGPIGSEIGLHSELASVLKMPYGAEFSRIKIINLRFKKDMSLGMARPCRGCRSLIKQLGFKEVWYTNSHGMLIKELIKE